MLKKEVVLQHINSLDKCQLVIPVAYDKKAIEDLENIVEEIDNSIKMQSILLGVREREDFVSALEKTSSYDRNNCIVLLCDYSQFEVMKAHSATREFKDRGYIVTSCFARNLFFEIPKDVSGITYQGIFDRTAKFVVGLPGDYLEFGVFDGRTMSLAYHCMKNIRGMEFYAFDSFAGIIGKSDGEAEAYNDGCYYSNLETFNHNMLAANVDLNRVHPIMGNFLNTTKSDEVKNRIKSAAVVHIDCDVYIAAKAALDFCADILHQGSIILFDEFHANHASNDLGERRALREWLEENPNIEVERWHDYAAVSRAYIVHIN